MPRYIVSILTAMCTLVGAASSPEVTTHRALQNIRSCTSFAADFYCRPLTDSYPTCMDSCKFSEVTLRCGDSGDPEDRCEIRAVKTGLSVFLPIAARRVTILLEGITFLLRPGGSSAHTTAMIHLTDYNHDGNPGSTVTLRDVRVTTSSRPNYAGVRAQGVRLVIEGGEFFDLYARQDGFLVDVSQGESTLEAKDMLIRKAVVTRLFRLERAATVRNICVDGDTYVNHAFNGPDTANFLAEENHFAEGFRSDSCNEPGKRYVVGNGRD